MQYELPHAARVRLASADVRVHHLLWHALRDSWHDFTAAQRQQVQDMHPEWVPAIPRFVSTPDGVRINPAAGESFLYMHRQMIQGVNEHLAELGEPALVPWDSIPSPGDAVYPVPGRTPHGPADDVKSDAAGTALAARAAALTDDALRSNPLATIGAYVESQVHDYLHMRWAGSPGAMADFPPFDPLAVHLEIPAHFDAPDVDWLGHPYSSHVNPVFWKLHGWVDLVIERWRVANGLHHVEWTDTWVGGLHTHTPHHDPHPPMPMDGGGGGMAPASHGLETMRAVLTLINRFPGCRARFDYVWRAGIPPVELAGPPRG